ncbi:MAG: hypothetical protein JST92_14405 [Deltaproteobacteria bacterium]|nr:hypothetical protein [Deltaproteobacteria bacterium]
MNPPVRRARFRGPQAQDLPVRTLVELGWERTNGDDFDLIWEVGQDHSYAPIAEARGAYRNHIKGMRALGIKSGLAESLTRAKARLALRGRIDECVNAPATFLMPDEYEALQEAARREPEALWIKKPKALARGEGVELLPSAEAAPKDAKFLVQRYLDKPFLIHGHKFTLRFYVLFSSVDPVVLWVYHDGFTKLTNRPFSTDRAHLADRFRHLTNPDVLEHDPLGNPHHNGTHQLIKDEVAKAGGDPEALFARIRQLIIRTALAGTTPIRETLRSSSLTGRGAFELLGFDVTVDDVLQPWLIECNTAPSLKVEVDDAVASAADETRIKRGASKDLLALVGAHPRFETPEPRTAAEHQARLDEQLARAGDFRLVYPAADVLEHLAHLESPSAMDLCLASRAAGSPKLRVHGVGFEVGNRVLALGSEDGTARWYDPGPWQEAQRREPFGPASHAQLATMASHGILTAEGAPEPRLERASLEPIPSESLTNLLVEVEGVRVRVHLDLASRVLALPTLGPLAPSDQTRPAQGALLVTAHADGFWLRDDRGRVRRVALEGRLGPALVTELKRIVQFESGELLLPGALLVLRPRRMALVVCARGVNVKALEEGLTQAGSTVRRGARISCGSAFPLQPLDVLFPHAETRVIAIVKPGNPVPTNHLRADALVRIVASARPDGPLAERHLRWLGGWLEKPACVSSGAEPQGLSGRLEQALGGWQLE